MQDQNQQSSLGQEYKAQETKSEASSYRLITRSLTGDAVDTWGLQRILERKVVASDFVSFQCFTTGRNVDIYVVDSGVNANHVEFYSSEPGETRVSVLFDAFGGHGEDHLGHGTHMASLIAGQQVGFAVNAHLHIVKVFDRELAVNPDHIVAGLDRAIQHHQQKKSVRPSVLNLSFSTVKSGRIDRKIQEAVAAGMVVVCAAGNNNQEATMYSPAHLAEVITVGAIDAHNQLVSGERGSNFGSSVDILAPGFEVEGAGASNDRDYFKTSGSSVSAAYAAGVCACYLEQFPKADPFQVKEFLIRTATIGEAQFSQQATAQATPNRILFYEMQKLSPRWVDNNTTLVGIFFWGQEARAQVQCNSRTGSTLKYEVVDGHLPEGLVMTAAGEITGQLSPYRSEFGEKTQYYTFLIRATDTNGSTDRLFYCVATEEAEIQKENFTDAYLVELSKALCGCGCGCCSS